MSRSFPYWTHTLGLEGDTFRSAHAQNLKLILVVVFVLQPEGHYYCGQADPTSQLRETISTLLRFCVSVYCRRRLATSGRSF